MCPRTAAVDHRSTRDRLLAAAGDLLLERGFTGITTRAIAERAGVNNALVHYHFGTKRALLADAVLGLLGDDVEEPMRILRDAPSVTEGIADVLAWIDQLDLEQPSMRVLMELTIEAFRDETVRPVVAAALADGREQMAAALASRGDVEGPVAVPLAALLAALLDGVILHRMIDADLEVGSWAAAAKALAPTPAPAPSPSRRPRR